MLSAVYHAFLLNAISMRTLLTLRWLRRKQHSNGSVGVLHSILKGCEGDSGLLFNNQRKERLYPPLSRLELQHALLHQFQSLTTPHSPINRWTPSASSSATPAKSTYPPFLRLLFPTTQHALLSAALSMESGSSRRDVEILMC